MKPSEFPKGGKWPEICLKISHHLQLCQNVNNLPSKVPIKPSRPFCLNQWPTQYLLLTSNLSDMEDQHEFLRGSGGAWANFQWVKSQKKNLHLCSLPVSVWCLIKQAFVFKKHQFIVCIWLNCWMSRPKEALREQMPHGGDQQPAQCPGGWVGLELTEPYTPQRNIIWPLNLKRLTLNNNEFIFCFEFKFPLKISQASC